MGNRAGMSTLELVMIAAALAITALSVVPTYRKSRDAIAVERTARTLRYFNDTWRGEHSATNLVNAVWSDRVRLETFEYDSEGGSSVIVSLRSGDRRVTAADIAGLE